DLAEFPQQVVLAAEHRATAPGWLGRLETSRRAVRLEEVRAAYYGPPGLPALSPQVDDPCRVWALSEAFVGMVQVLPSLPVTWMTHPDVYRAAAHKPGQLTTATVCGLRVPRSYIGNDLAAARAWGEGIAGPLACKPIAAASLDLVGHPSLM